ncbi:hypothetical protein QJS04_geneDACA014799 [Acorus gramineus]|uniref:Uncharacterized protein n=1 Tax=Acorus gramineus TaxID=55184 RepID=A0AAV9BMI6_ACOGR|nr:hypothetical protein QJS04_geneDACA014799 [Acorus gramineus]
MVEDIRGDEIGAEEEFCARGEEETIGRREEDEHKIKRKIGRKLPSLKNATNVQIKSKGRAAIVLLEQSLASDWSGLAVSKKGLTLKEQLQQSSQHNPKMRKGIVDSSSLFGVHRRGLGTIWSTLCVIIDG